MSDVGFLSGPVGFVKKMAKLPANTFVTIRSPETAEEIKLQVISPERFFGRKQYSGTEWKRSGDEWTGVLFQSQPGGWSKTPVLLLKLDTAGYILRRRVMPPEEAGSYSKYAEKFGHQAIGQVPGSVKMPYYGKQFAIQDIGIWDVESNFGKAHLPPGVMARWIVAHGDGGSAVIIEDGQGNNDSAWEGWVVDLDRVVVDILTPTGE